MKKYYAMILFFLFAAVASAQDNYDCNYFRPDKKDLITKKNCLTYIKGVRNKITGGDALISKKVADTAYYDENDLGHLYTSVGVFYFTKSGLVRRALYFDNGPDYFVNGLARTEWNGKIGFFNKELSIVIEPEYDFAFPFEKGISIVCMGCTMKKTGEYTKMVGGKWGAINLNGEIVQPIIYSKDELQKILK
jgi:hypothetical protein